jgi:hypothetical protein
MNRYAVSVLSFFENENKCFIVSAKDEVSAMKQALIDFCHVDVKSDWEEWIEHWGTIEEVKEHAFNGEIAISTPILITS